MWLSHQRRQRRTAKEDKGVACDDGDDSGNECEDGEP